MKNIGVGDGTKKDTFVVRDGVLVGYNGTEAEIHAPAGVKAVSYEAFKNTGLELVYMTPDTIPYYGLENLGKLAIRVDSKGKPGPNGDFAIFGSYPQSLVMDRAVKLELNNAAGALPTPKKRGKWTSYRYFTGECKDGSARCSSDFMWYIDVELNGIKYRGVYFISYRPDNTDSTCMADNTFQDDNGFLTSTVYWFKYEPIKWRIVKEHYGKALLVSDMILDSQAYQNCCGYQAAGSERKDTWTTYYVKNCVVYTETGKPAKLDGKGRFANSYEYSSIRKWLNADFYNASFTDAEKASFSATQVDDDSFSTSSSDCIFLLSEAEAGLCSDGARNKKPTDYAKCQGVADRWLLRSNGGKRSRDVKKEDKSYSYNNYYIRYRYEFVSCVKGGITVQVPDIISHTSTGVCPALWVEL